MGGGTAAGETSLKNSHGRFLRAQTECGHASRHRLGGRFPVQRGRQRRRREPLGEREDGPGQHEGMASCTNEDLVQAFKSEMVGLPFPSVVQLQGAGLGQGRWGLDSQGSMHAR